MSYAVEMKNITKRFADVTANDQIDFSVKKGEIHCLLGENGAGKSTLMKILFGLYSRDQGEIFINGKKVNLKGPMDAIKHEIGMIHQHFMLAKRLSVAENIIAGLEPVKNFIVLNIEEARSRLKNLSREYGLNINPDAVIEEISVGEQQRVEILKVLYRKAEILILDEPTAVLTPQEVEELFKIMRSLKESGKTIIFITHKLKETMEVSDRITVLRDGRNIGTVKTENTSPRDLAEMMVGREVLLQVEKDDVETGEEILSVKKLNAANSKSGLKLKNINFSLKSGEILGVAGVEGNGQLELEEALTGLMEVKSGEVYLNGQDITRCTTKERRHLGIAHIPSDRHKRGMIEEFTVADNLIFGSEWDSPFAENGIMQKNIISDYAQKAILDFDIRCAAYQIEAGSLSGGNQQKLVIARELMRNPELIIAAQPTRGVDVGAIEYIHNKLLAMRKNKKAVLLISAELDELRSLSDRIIVIYEGEIVAEGRTENFTEQELGLLMAGHKEEAV